jgi:ATP phosphoribosyltransferase
VTDAPEDRPLLKIAVPNKGSLADAATTMLKEAGYRQRWDLKDLVLVDERNGVEFYYLRPRDIAVYVGEGTLDVGITGRDMLLDSRAPADEVLSLGFGATKFRFAAPEGSGVADVRDLEGKRLATSYPGLLSAYLADRGVTARMIPLDGAVESAIRLGVADAIADVVETGTTLKRAGLDVFGESILESEAILIRHRGRPETAGYGQLIRRLQGVIVARDFVLVDYNIADDLLEAAKAVAPGREGPTISPLARDGWSAVRTMVPRKQAQTLMDQLWEVGARAILVTDIAACRL